MVHNERFEPGVWHPISSKQVIVSFINSLVQLVWVAIALALALFVNTLWYFAVAAVAVVFIVNLFLIPRRIRYTQYQLREDDIMIRSGVMFRQVTAIPYGRLQVVDIVFGPVERRLQLARLKISTASISSTVTLPGLMLEDAKQLRDVLIEVAETRRAGL